MPRGWDGAGSLPLFLRQTNTPYQTWYTGEQNSSLAVLAFLLQQNSAVSGLAMCPHSLPVWGLWSWPYSHIALLRVIPNEIKHILAKLIIYTRMPWHLFRHKLLCSDIYPDSSCQIFWHTFRHLSWHVVWLGLTCGLTFILTIWVFLGHMFWQWSWYQFWHLICKIFI